MRKIFSDKSSDAESAMIPYDSNGGIDLCFFASGIFDGATVNLKVRKDNLEEYFTIYSITKTQGPTPIGNLPSTWEFIIEIVGAGANTQLNAYI